VLTQPGLLGRQAELEAIDRLVATTPESGGVLVLRGEAGIGKSALLAEAVASASRAGIGVLRVTGVRTEAHLPFAGLHQLLRPILADLDELPPPQRSALEAAFGLADGASTDPFLISLATLTLLTDAAAERPILAVVDDAQWLDRPTDEVLAFVARRLGSDPVALLIAILDGQATSIEAAGLPVLVLQPLADGAARELLDRGGHALAPAVRDRVIREAGGNPLALVELPAALPVELDGGASGTLPVTARVERAFAAKVVDLPATTSILLLVAAVEDQGSVDEILAAGKVLGVADADIGSLTPALDAGLLLFDDGALRFRHPLVRSAVLQRANAVDRCAAHNALAEVVLDADRVAWHRAAAAIGPDEAVASLLDAAAERADRRSAIAVAAAALERAARLSSDGQARGTRLLRAADRAYALGRPDIMARLLRDAEPLDIPTLEDRRQAWLRALELNGPTTIREEAHIRQVADAAERAAADGDVDLGMALLLLAAARCWWIDASPALRERLVEIAVAIAPDPDDPRVLYVLAASPSEHGTEVVARLRRWLASTDPIEPDDARVLATTAMWIGDLDTARELFASSVASQRAQGRLGLVARTQVLTGWSALHVGKLSDVRPALDEGLRLAEETSQQFIVTTAHTALAQYHALRGDLDAGAVALVEAERVALETPAEGLFANICHAHGMLDLAAGRYEEAFEFLRHIYEPGDRGYHTVVRSWVVSDLVDAAIPSGRAGEASRYLATLETDPGLMASPWQRISTAYARAVMAADGDDADAAETAFASALAPELQRWPLPRARVLLAYGSWLRRQRRVVESRGPLRTARELFDAMGVAWMGERARRELGASGEASRARGAYTLDELTPQELQIARLAADGLSNREIGERLYLSHRTVGFHLYHVYPKLGISSRAQLHAALAG